MVTMHAVCAGPRRGLRTPKVSKDVKREQQPKKKKKHPYYTITTAIMAFIASIFNQSEFIK